MNRRQCADKFAALALVFALTGCVQKMGTRGHLKPLDPGAAWDIPAGTVARGQLHFNDAPPPKRSLSLLKRGQERFNIYCSPCHDRTGSAMGMVVQQGFLVPPVFHSDQARGLTDQQIYDFITYGRGAMFSYADRIVPEDRWAIVAYIRALQLSQHIPVSMLTPEERAKLPKEGGR